MWVLIDFSYLAYRAFYTIQDLEFNEMPTGIIYGFFEQLRSICEDPRIQTNKIALFFDSRKSFRRRTYPEYKSGRLKALKEMTPEEVKAKEIMRAQMKLLQREVLPAIGFSLYKQTGLESDDLIAQTALQISAIEKVIIITSDADLYQCITENVSWFDPARDSFLGPLSFFDKKKLHPEKWARVKAIGGCHSDDVEGIPGVGEKTAIEYILGTLPTHYKRYQAIESDEGRKILQRNLELVTLPHHKTKPVDLKEPCYKPEVFEQYCEKFGMMSYLENKKEGWRRFFSGEFDKSQTFLRGRKSNV